MVFNAGTKRDLKPPNKHPRGADVCCVGTLTHDVVRKAHHFGAHNLPGAQVCYGNIAC